jgi:G3E family GTPase
MKPAIESTTASVVLLSGFLGAGKTTLLRRILSWEGDLTGTVVIVNEFGQVGIDGTLLRDAGSDMVELTSGCICCTLSADLKQSLKRILARFDPERVLIESSGVADPGAIAEALTDAAIAERMRLEKTITVLDADFWEAREAFGPLFYNQLEMADLILLNKVDLVPAGKIPLFLDEMHDLLPRCQVVPTVHCGVDPDTLWSKPARKAKIDLKPIDFFQPSPLRDESAEENAHPHQHVDASNYVTFTYESEERMDEARFQAFVQALPFELFRMKGPVRFADRCVMVNHVGGRCEIVPWPDENRTLLAFIGWNLSGETFLQQLNQCTIGAVSGSGEGTA